jgi:hypothetical protein
MLKRALRGSDPAACTIVTRNFLSYARIVGRSYLQHHPGSRFYVLVVDGLPDGVEAGGGIEVVTPEALDLPYLHELCFKYNVVELSTAVKPSFLAHLLGREESIVYLDPDILVMRRFAELWRELDRAPIVLTPHLLKPIPMDGLRPNEQDMLISGAYNLGFLAIRRSQDVDELLAWWATRLRDGCRIDVPNGLFTDQKWIDLVPCYFASTAVLRDPTYNVAFWNLHERRLERRGSAFFAEGRPIAFFHFSGFTPTIPSNLSRHQTRTQVEKRTPLAELLNLYVDLHMRNGYARSTSTSTRSYALVLATRSRRAARTRSSSGRRRRARTVSAASSRASTGSGTMLRRRSPMCGARTGTRSSSGRGPRAPARWATSRSSFGRPTVTSSAR